jgi:hypothetical protein
MSNVTASLDRKEEAVRCPMVPSFKGFFLGQAIEGDIQLHGVQVLGVELEPPSLRKVRGIEDSVPPVRIIVPTRADGETRLRSRVRSSGFGVQIHPVNDDIKIEAGLSGTESLEAKTLSDTLWKPL